MVSLPTALPSGVQLAAAGSGVLNFKHFPNACPMLRGDERQTSKVQDLRKSRVNYDPHSGPRSK